MPDRQRGVGTDVRNNSGERGEGVRGRGVAGGGGGGGGGGCC